MSKSLSILLFSLKGGVGKSSIALNYAIENDMDYVTNDIVTNLDKEHFSGSRFSKIAHGTKRVPKNLLKQNTVYDFGAMSSVIDHKVTQMVEFCDGVIIPTLTDVRSLKATVDTYNFIKNDAKSIVIVINNFNKENKYDYARKYLMEHIENPRILSIRSTTLFERVARDGADWYLNIGHDKGEWQLNKTKKSHKQKFNHITHLIRNTHAYNITNF